MRKLLVKSINLNDSHILLGELTSLRTQKLKLLCTTIAAEKVLLSRIFHLISMVTQRHARFHPKKARRLQ